MTCWVFSDGQLMPPLPITERKSPSGSASAAGALTRATAANAAMVGIDLSRTKYSVLGDLATATEKARRDAPAIPVCAL